MIRMMSVIAFILSFGLEVHVRAGNIRLAKGQAPLQQPSGCLFEVGEKPCAIGTRLDEKFTMEISEGWITLGSKASMVFLAERPARYISGNVLVKADKELQINSEFGEIQFELNSKAMLWRDEEKLFISTLEGTVWAIPRGSKEKMKVPQGYENWVGSISSQTATALTGRPTAAVFQRIVERWAQLTNLTPKEFSEAVNLYAETWRVATKTAADMHAALYQRKMASVNEIHERQTKVKAKIEEEQKEIRQLYRRKILNFE